MAAAGKLAELSPDELTVVTVRSLPPIQPGEHRSGGAGWAAEATALSVSVQAPGWAEYTGVSGRSWLTLAERIAEAWTDLDGIDELLDRLRPKGGVVGGKVSADHERYFALKELADGVSETLNAYEDRLEDAKLARLEAVAQRRRRGNLLFSRDSIMGAQAGTVGLILHI